MCWFKICCNLILLLSLHVVIISGRLERVEQVCPLQDPLVDFGPVLLNVLQDLLVLPDGRAQGVLV